MLNINWFLVNKLKGNSFHVQKFGEQRPKNMTEQDWKGIQEINEKLAKVKSMISDLEEKKDA